MIRTRRMACTACRQSKSRCEKGDGPCRRCEKHRLVCKEDPQFHRHNKNRFDEIEERINGFLQTLAQTQNINLSPVSPERAQMTNYGPLAQPQSISQTRASVPQLPQTSHSDLPLVTSQQQPALIPPPVSAGAGSHYLGTLELNGSQTTELFNIFFVSYHPFLPFLEPEQPPDNYFVKSPLLFWAIVSIAARRYESDVGLLRKLSNSVTKLAWETISMQGNKLTTVQALLLLCTWPFPTSSLWLESTPVWADIAMSMSIQLGLYQPDMLREFNRLNSTPSMSLQLERAKAWFACTSVVHSNAAIYGSLPAAVFKFAPQGSVRDEYLTKIPVLLQYQAEIQAFCGKATRTMFDNPIDLLGPHSKNVIALVSGLEAELESLVQGMAELPDITRHYYLSAKLFLRTQHFFNSDSSNERRVAILQAYNSAISLISSMITADAGLGLFAHIPAYLFRMLFTAAGVVFKVLSSSYRQDVDLDLGKTTLNEAITAMRKCSVENNDVPGRHAEIIRQLWLCAETLTTVDTSQPPVLSHKSRFGASLSYDCLFQWRETVGGQRSTGLHSSTTIPIGSDAVGGQSPREIHPLDESGEQFSREWSSFDWTWGRDMTIGDFGFEI